MSGLGESIYRPFHRPGLEAAGREDEWDDTPPPPGEVGMVAVAYKPPVLCRHKRRWCNECDYGGCTFHRYPCSCWARQATAKPPTDELDPF